MNKKLIEELSNLYTGIDGDSWEKGKCIADWIDEHFVEKNENESLEHIFGDPIKEIDNLIPQPIQKEEVKECRGCGRKAKEKICPNCDYLMEEPNKILHPTPSDTFIEEKMKEFDNLPLKDIRMKDAFQFYDPEKIKNILKSSLQSQRQSILEEIEKMKFPEIDNGDSGIKYPLAKKSDPDALMQFAFNEALKQLLESIKRT